MAKLIKILVASVGGGLVLGAGIRLGEAMATWEPASEPHHRKLSERLDELENRLQHVAGQGDGVGLSAESQAATPVTLAQIRPDQQGAEAFSKTSLRLRGELQGWLEQSVAGHMAEVELRLQAESERDRKQMLDALVENVQTRVIQRISHLEEEVAGQSAAMSELRECSLRTERSIQKLLGGLDRLVVREQAGNEQAGKDTPAAPPTAHSKEATSAPAELPGGAPAFASPPARSSRWKFSGEHVFG